MFILVDDSPYNIASSKAVHNIVIKSCCNTSKISMNIMKQNTVSK